MPTRRRLQVDALARVEGEGALEVEVEDGVVTHLALRIYEPPRYFERFLVGRTYLEVTDLTARICGICPVAYQMSAALAVERAFGVQVPPEITALRRLLYLAEWVESHALHIYFLAAPDFLGYESALTMAADHRAAVERGLRLKRLGNDLMAAIGGREVHPVSPRPGGFWKVPSREDLRPFLPRVERALEEALETVRWVSGFDFPNRPLAETPLLAVREPDRYGLLAGRIVSDDGLDLDPSQFEAHVEEHQVPHSHAFHARLRDGRIYRVGPLARVSLNADRLSPLARQALAGSPIPFPTTDMYASIVARAVELVHALEEGLALLRTYTPPDPPYVDLTPRPGWGWGATEAPRGILYHAYRFDEEGRILEARIVPPTAQNQAAIEADLRALVPQILDLPEEDFALACEQAVRNYDPCISCATHFLRVTLRRR